VDPINRRQFWELIHHLAAEGTTVFVTTHYMDEAEYCDRIALIYRGELIALDSPEKLKTTVMSEDVLEVACEHPIEALDFLQPLPEVREVAIFGNGLHLVVDEAAAAAPVIRRELQRNHVIIEHVEKIRPSMEDVFVSLIEARDRAQSASREVTA